MSLQIAEPLQELLNSNFKNAMSYKGFRSLMDELHEQGLVTGDHQSADLLEYSKMNTHRMNRWDKHYKPNPALLEVANSIQTDYNFLIITEGWCGDSAQIVPAFEKMIEGNKHLHSHYILRDDNPEIMDLFLSNGSRSIPIIVCFDSFGKIVWKWGPRPAEAQSIVDQAKREDWPKDEMKEKVHLWYARNKQAALEQEMLELFASLRH